jgi:hypothetical protein
MQNSRVARFSDVLAKAKRDHTKNISIGNAPEVVMEFRGRLAENLAIADRAHSVQEVFDSCSFFAGFIWFNPDVI